MSEIKKILIIASFPLIPTSTGGKIRALELAKGLADNQCQVSIAVPMSLSQFKTHKLKENLVIKPIAYPFLLPFLFTDRPFPYLNLISFHFGYHLLLNKLFNSADIIQFEGVSFANLVDYLPKNKTVVYNAHNIEYDYAKAESGWRWVNKICQNRIYKLEKKLAQRADRIIACSSNDSERMAKLYNVNAERIGVVPNGVHFEKKIQRQDIESISNKFPTLMSFPQRAIFSGSDVAHNRAAVEFIIKTLAPKLDKHCAFVIKGQCGNRFKYKKHANVFFEADATNVGMYAGVCTVALNPVMQGSGTSLKILDYLAHGIPVLSTEFGMRGFDSLKDFVTLSVLDEFCARLEGDFIFNTDILERMQRYSWGFISKSLAVSYHAKI